MSHHIPSSSSSYSLLDIVSKAVRKSKKKYIDKALEMIETAGKEINKKNEDGGSALYVASGWNNLQILHALLLNPNTDVNAADNDGGTPLMNACLLDKLPNVQALLLHQNLEVNARDNNGYTAFILACMGKNVQIVQALLQNPKVKVDAQNHKMETALTYACSNNQLPIVQELLKKLLVVEGILWKNREGQTPMDIAAKHPAIANALFIAHFARTQDVQTGLEITALLPPLREIITSYVT